MSVIETVRFLMQHGNELAPPVPVGELPAMRFACSFSEAPAAAVDLSRYFVTVPSDLAEFWLLAKSARLFEDQTYGQWGLELLDPVEAEKRSRRFAAEREREALRGDLVIGRFLGDSDLLVLRCDSSNQDFGATLVALPIDRRAEWYRPAATFSEFLRRYASEAGEKYWE